MNNVNNYDREVIESGKHQIGNIDESGIYKGYYNRTKAGLEDDLSKITQEEINSADNFFNEMLNKEDPQDRYYDMQYLLNYFKRARNTTDLDKFLFENSQSLNLLSVVTTVSRSYMSGLGDNIENALYHFAETIQRASMYMHPEKLDELREKRSERDNEQINSIQRDIKTNNLK